MKHYGNGQQRRKLDALAALFVLEGHGRKKNDSGELHAGEIDAFDQPFRQASVSFKDSCEEMKERQSPSVCPNPDARRAAISLDREKYSHEDGKNNDDGKFVGQRNQS